MKRLTLRLTEKLHEKLRSESFETETSMNELILRALDSRYNNKPVKMVSREGKWDIIVDGTIYHFYYSNSEPLKGLLLSGCNEQRDEYCIGSNIISARRVESIYKESEHRYVLTMAKRY